MSRKQHLIDLSADERSELAEDFPLQPGQYAREDPSTGFDDLAQAHIERFDGVGGVDGAAYLRRIAKHRYQSRPIGTP